MPETTSEWLRRQEREAQARGDLRVGLDDIVSVKISKPLGTSTPNDSDELASVAREIKGATREAVEALQDAVTRSSEMPRSIVVGPGPASPASDRRERVRQELLTSSKCAVFVDNHIVAAMRRVRDAVGAGRVPAQVDREQLARAYLCGSGGTVAARAEVWSSCGEDFAATWRLGGSLINDTPRPGEFLADLLIGWGDLVGASRTAARNRITSGGVKFGGDAEGLLVRVVAALHRHRVKWAEITTMVLGSMADAMTAETGRSYTYARELGRIVSVKGLRVARASGPPLSSSGPVIWHEGVGHSVEQREITGNHVAASGATREDISNAIVGVLDRYAREEIEAANFRAPKLIPFVPCERSDLEFIVEEPEPAARPPEPVAPRVTIVADWSERFGAWRVVSIVDGKVRTAALVPCTRAELDEAIGYIRRMLSFVGASSRAIAPGEPIPEDMAAEMDAAAYTLESGPATLGACLVDS